VAGNGTAAFAGDGGPANLASLNGPIGVIVDASGNLYIADSGNNRIRRVDSATGIITTIAGTGNAIFDGDGISATSASLNLPAYLAFNSSGNLVFTDASNGRVRMIDKAGLIWTLAGTGPTKGNVFFGNGSASLRSLKDPVGLAVSSLGPMYVSELTGSTVYSIVPPNTVATAVTVSAGGNSFPSGSPVTLTVTLAATNGQACNATNGIAIFDGSTQIYGGRFPMERNDDHFAVADRQP
jgi:trimeric autotransporter adhesin